MPAPNPIWGLHIAPGTAAWAKVLKQADGKYRVLQWSIEDVPSDPAEAVRKASERLALRGVRGWPVFAALPDASGAFTSAKLSSDELDLQGEDLQRELHEHTHFEPGTAALRHRFLRAEGRRRVFLVGALPVAQFRRFEEILLAKDDGTVGIGLGSAALWRGAQALGYIRTPCFLVDVQTRQTLVFAADTVVPADGGPGGLRVRRYLVAGGCDDVRSSEDQAAAAEMIAGDVRSVAEYHRGQSFGAGGAPTDLPDPVFVALSRALADKPIRNAMTEHLGTGFDTTLGQGEPSEGITFDVEPGDMRIALVGAIGAALDGFEPPESRLAYRHLPREISPPAERSPWPWVAVAALAAGAAWWFLGRGSEVPGGTSADPPAAMDPALQTRCDGLVLRAAYADLFEDASTLLSLDRHRRAALGVTPSADGGALHASLSLVLGDASRDVRRDEAELLQSLRSRAGALDGSVAYDESGAPVLTWSRVLASRFDSSTCDAAAADRLKSWRTPRVPSSTDLSGESAPLAFALRQVGLPDRPVSVRIDGSSLRIDAAEIDVSPAPAASAVAWRDLLQSARDRDLPGRLRERETSAAPAAGPMKLVATADPAGSVQISWDAPSGGGARRIVRIGPFPDPTAVVVADASSANGRMTDWISRAGRYRWSVVTSADPQRETVQVREGDVTADVRPRIDVAVLADSSGGGAILRLSRLWKGTTLTSDVAVAPGSSVLGSVQAPGETEPVAMDPGLSLRAVRVRVTKSSADSNVPRLLPSGGVERDERGSPRMETRRLDRPVREIDADLIDGSGSMRTVSGKMTDG